MKHVGTCVGRKAGVLCIKECAQDLSHRSENRRGLAKWVLPVINLKNNTRTENIVIFLKDVGPMKGVGGFLLSCGFIFLSGWFGPYFKILSAIIMAKTVLFCNIFSLILSFNLDFFSWNSCTIIACQHPSAGNNTKQEKFPGFYSNWQSYSPGRGISPVHKAWISYKTTQLNMLSFSCMSLLA